MLSFRVHKVSVVLNVLCSAVQPLLTSIRFPVIFQRSNIIIIIIINSNPPKFLDLPFLRACVYAFELCFLTHRMHIFPSGRVRSHRSNNNNDDDDEEEEKKNGILILDRTREIYKY